MHLMGNTKKVIQRFLFIGLFLGCVAWAQSQTVSGTLKELNGTPIWKATVRVSQKAFGELTGRAGEFTVKYVQPGDTLIFSFIGYQPAYYIAKESDVYIEAVMKPVLLQLSLSKQSHAPGWLHFTEAKEPPASLYLNEEVVTAYHTAKTMSEEDGCYYTQVEAAPSLRFGVEEWNKVLETGIPALRKNGIGELVIDSVVDEKGAVTETRVNKSYHRKLDQKITDHLFKNTQWNPAVQNGRVVPAVCQLRFEVIPVKGKLHLRSVYYNIS